MIDKKLLRMLGSNRKYIFDSVAMMILGLLANITVTACICQAIRLAAQGAASYGGARAFVPLALLAAAGMGVRYAASRLSGRWKEALGRSVKRDLRRKVYDKIIRLGVRSTDELSMAGLTQVSLEGVEQLDLYYSSYIPQFFYAMAAPVILFCVTVGVDWRAALVLLLCVPLIPLSIVAVSRYAKKIFAKYRGKYTSMGDSFLDSVQGMKELKIFRADGRQHQKMNAASEEFRKITMKVLVMQLASTTVMDLVAYGGAGIGIALAIYDVVHRGLFFILVAVDFFLPLRAFGSAFHVAMNGASAGKKILSLLEQPEPVWGTQVPTGTACRLENVSFSYDGSRQALKNVSMAFQAPGVTAIVGESGCGKSTVVNLLTGAFRPQSGTVYVGETPLAALSREGYYARLAVVSCNTYLFNESVRDNFRLAGGERTEEEMYAALEKATLPGSSAKTAGWTGLLPRMPPTSPAGRSSGWRWPSIWLPTGIFTSLTRRPATLIPKARPLSWPTSARLPRRKRSLSFRIGWPISSPPTASIIWRRAR